MTDDDHGVRIAGDVVLEPQRAFEVEIVGRLVEQQQVGLTEQHRGERDAHAPAAGKFGARAFEISMSKAEPGEDRRGPRGGGMRRDVAQARMDFGDAVRIGRGLRLREQQSALAIGAEHEIDERLGPVRRFLRQRADACARRDDDASRLRGKLACDHSEQGGFARTVAADKADPRPGGNLRRGVFDQQTAGDADGQIIDGEHALLNKERA